MCDEAVDGTQVDVLLDESSDGVDMSGMVTVLDSRHVYQGAIFGVDDLRIALPMRDGGQTVIRRQVMRHAPCVVMLVHDCANDLYLIEREYRIGCGAFAYGLPAGLIDGGEDVEEAALRELREETGAVASELIPLGPFYPTCAYSTEVIQMFLARGLSFGERELDEDEFLNVFRLPLRELVEKVLNGEIPDAKTQAAALRVWCMLQEGKLS